MMKKTLKTLALMLALVTMSTTLYSCDSDDNNEEEVTGKAVADQIVGSYYGDMSITVSSSTDILAEAPFVIEKVDDTHVNITLPAFGSAPMALPAITVKNVEVKESNGVVIIPATTFDQTIQVNGNDKNISNTALEGTISSDKMAIKFTMKYGNMPFSMTCEATEAVKNGQTAAGKAVGTYCGDMTCTVSSSTSTVEDVEFNIEKVDATHVNVILPAFGEAPMALPSITVENLEIIEKDDVLSIPTTSFDQTIQVDGKDKNISNTAIQATITDGKLTVDFSMKYGNMPFSMICAAKDIEKK